MCPVWLGVPVYPGSIRSRNQIPFAAALLIHLVAVPGSFSVLLRLLSISLLALRLHQSDGERIATCFKWDFKC